MSGTLLVVAALMAAVPFAHGAQQFVFLSDIHFDMYYGTPQAYGGCVNSSYPRYGYTGCDAPLELVESTMADITANHPNVPIILTGDWLRHDMHLLEISDAIAMFARLSAMFSNLPHDVIPLPSILTTTIGNNDVIPDYYFDITNNNSDPHYLLGNMTQAMTNNSLLSESEAALFSRCAMFSRVIGDLTFVVLNTLVWSTKLDPPVDPVAVADPCGQFAFLRDALQQAKASGRKAVLLSHIPPTLNLYDVLVTSNDKEYLQSQYLDTYASLLQEFNTTLAAQFYGHTHELTTLGDTLFPAPGFIIPAITPNYGNNPSYLIGTYDGYFQGLSQRFFNNGLQWETVTTTLDSVLGPFDTSANVRAAAIALYTDDTKWNFFQQVHAGGTLHDIWPVDCNLDCRKRVICSMTEFRTVGFQSCVANPFPTTTPQSTTTLPPADDPSSKTVSIVVVILCVLSFILGVAGLVLVVMRLRAAGGSSYGEEGASLAGMPGRQYEETA